MGSEHQSVLFQVLSRLFKLCHEISLFVLSQNNHHLYITLKMVIGLLNLHYILTDIFEHLNELNIKIPIKNENILTCSDK